MWDKNKIFSVTELVPSLPKQKKKKKKLILSFNLRDDIDLDS